MKILFPSLLMMIFLGGCSVYKSEGRKDFDSDAPAKISAASLTFQLKNCKKQSSIETWFSEEFPAANYELVTSETDLEIWKTTHRDGSLEVKALQKTDNATLTCTYEFPNSAAWTVNKEQFIRELENNLMTSE